MVSRDVEFDEEAIWNWETKKVERKMTLFPDSNHPPTNAGDNGDDIIDKNSIQTMALKRKPDKHTLHPRVKVQRMLRGHVVRKISLKFMQNVQLFI